MKPRLLLGIAALAFAGASLGATAVSLGASRSTANSPMAPLTTVMQELADAPVLPPKEAEPKPTTAAIDVKETDEAIPGDIKIVVRKEGPATKINVARRGHLVALRRAGVRNAGPGAATLVLKDGDDVSEPLVAETTSSTTLETTRVVLHVIPADDGAAPSLKIRAAEAPKPAGREEHRRHKCLAHQDGFGGFAVLCRIETEVMAANLTAKEKTENVTVMSAFQSLVRFDFDAQPGAVETRALVYNDAGHSVLVRAEMSFLPKEKAPSLAIVSSERAQPVVIRRRPHWHEWIDIDVFD